MEETNIIQDTTIIEQNQPDNHPLESSTPTFEVAQNQLDDRTLLDDQGRPNVSRSPSTVQATAQEPLDSDTSHAKVKYNVDLFDINKRI